VVLARAEPVPFPAAGPTYLPAVADLLAGTH